VIRGQALVLWSGRGAGWWTLTESLFRLVEPFHCRRSNSGRKDWDPQKRAPKCGEMRSKPSKPDGMNKETNESNRNEDENTDQGLAASMSTRSNHRHSDRAQRPGAAHRDQNLIALLKLIRAGIRAMLMLIWPGAKGVKRTQMGRWILDRLRR
jgi:hypothetical protein